MSKTRFIQWIVLACIGTLAACTSSEDGTVGNTELNVIVPTNAGTPNEIDIQIVEYTINCEGNNDTFLDNVASFPDEVTLNGNLEVVDGRTDVQGPIPPDFGTPRPFDQAEVWQGFMDLPPGPCTVELRARDNDGEVICTAREGFSITADATAKVNLVLICDISYQAPVGMLDVDATFSFNVGNFCPDLFQLNCLDSEPALPLDEFGDPTGDAETTCEVRLRDGDSTCGAGCDPQSCVADPADPLAGLVCTPGPDPGQPTTLVTCAGGSTDCDGDGVADPAGCTYDGDQLGTLATNAPIIGNAATFNVLCDGSPGATVTCTAVTTDGDEDCNKTKTVDVLCPGDTPCTTFGGDAQCEALAATVCTVDTCNTGTCDGATEAACCDNVPVADGLDCSAELPPLAECVGGTCTAQACVVDDDCDNTNPCTQPRSCDAASGFCCAVPGTCTSNESPLPVAGNPDCTTGSVADGFCDGAGVCEPYVCRVGTEATDCDDTNGCTTDTCNGAVPGGQCNNTNLPDETVCTDVTDGKCFVVPPDTVSQCFGSECTLPADCTGGTSCTDTPICDTSVNPGGVCVYPPLAQGERCPSTLSTTCQSGLCGECDGAGICNEKDLSCDPVFRDVVTCQSIELLALDCQLLGSGAPLVLDAQATPAAAAVNGVPLDINPVLVLNLPASLVCGFASVVPSANVFDSIANLNLVNSAPSQIGLNSFLGGIPHGAVFFDFTEGCGNQAGSCVGGLCNNTAVECTTATEVVDCSGTGPGVIVPFVSTTAPDSITPSSPFVSLQYSVADLGAYVGVPALTATLCLGDLATVAGSPTGQCSFTCVPTDRTDGGNIAGDDSPRVIYDAGCDKIGVAACGGTACATDADCPINAAGQTCNLAVNLCNPVNLGFCGGTAGQDPTNALPDPVAGTCSDAGGATCFEDADCAAPSNANPSGGSCVGTTPGVCLDGATPCAKDRDCSAFSVANGIPVCCGDVPGTDAFFDFSNAANVCGTGDPGSALADTQAPCTGNEDPRSERGRVCRGVASCGSCQQETVGFPTVESCSAVPGFGEAGKCSGTGGFVSCLANGDLDCRGANGVGIGTLGEDYCIVPCLTCDTADCCQYMQDRFPSATTTQFPLIPVN